MVLFWAVFVDPSSAASKGEISQLRHELSAEFYKSRFQDTLAWITIGLSALGVFIAVLGHLGLKGLANAKGEFDEATKQVRAAKGEINDQVKAIKELAAKSESLLNELEAKKDEWGAEDIASTMDRIERVEEQLKVINEVLEKKKFLSVAGDTIEAPADDSAALVRIMEALKDTRFRWRSIERLSHVAGIDAEKTRKLLQRSDDVVFSVGKSGRTIVRLKTR